VTPERRQHRSDGELRKQRDQLRRDWEARSDGDAATSRRIAVAKRDRTQIDNVRTVPSVSPMEPGISDSEIARRAYALYEERGGEHGHDVDDWLQAERELTEPARSTAA